MIVEIAETLKKEKPSRRIYLLGISMGGNGVVHALLEADRRKESLFSAALTFSAAAQLSITPGWQLSSFEMPEGQKNPWGDTLGSGKTSIYKMAVSRLITQFDQIVHQSNHQKFDLADDQVPVFFYNAFESRLKFLRTQPTTEGLDLSSVETYSYSCNLSHWITKVKTPLVMIHAADDPSVAYQQFQELEFLGKKNPNILFVGLENGGHWGFVEAFTARWVADIINRALMIGAPVAPETPPGETP
jgi:predicted alpha/beta-fold hydrolase